MSLKTRLKQRLKDLVRNPSRPAVSSSLSDSSAAEAAALVSHMVETGEGTEECLKLKCLPMPVHFYSPVPDIDDLRARRVWARRSPLSGINLRSESQLELLRSLGAAYAGECRWPHDPTRDDTEFFTNNSGFSYGCAAALHMMIRRAKPRRVIEIGSGSSSRVIAAALRMNAAEADGSVAEYTIIDPYPTEQTRTLPGLTRVIDEPVERIDLTTFAALVDKDILFVDSGHTVRIGGDVNFLILDVLPILSAGVLAHFHDIPMPYEYAEVYYTNPKFRMFWTESYLLQAFLCFNGAYDVLLAMNHLMLDHTAAFRAALPHYNPEIHQHASHSFWIQRKE